MKPTILAQTPAPQNGSPGSDCCLVPDHPNNSDHYHNLPFLMKYSSLQHRNEYFKKVCRATLPRNIVHV